jgi:hypothetical protein
MGFMGTVLAGYLIPRQGLLRAGINSLFLQLCMLTLACSIYFVYLSGPSLALGPGMISINRVPLPVVVFAVLVVTSRVGLWCDLVVLPAGFLPGLLSLTLTLFVNLTHRATCAALWGFRSFDMVNAQLAQQTVPVRQIASASAAEMALCNFSELFMLGLAAVAVSPTFYRTLVVLSVGAVGGGNILFRRWAATAQPQIDTAIAQAALA